jgi:catalase
MSKGADNVREKSPFSLRISDAKAQGVVRGKLIVNQNISAQLRQGLFTDQGRVYDVIIRFSHTPGEYTNDRKISTPRGIAKFWASKVRC